MTLFADEPPDPRRGSETTSDLYKAEVRVERRRERYGWNIRIAMFLLLVAFVAVCVAFGTPRFFGSSDLVAAATVFGVSAIFAAVLVPCVLLLLSRSRAAAEMLEDITDIRSQIRRGRAYGLSIRGYRKSDRPSG
jgi:hypothetical protein